MKTRRLSILNNQIIRCKKCPRLVVYTRKVAIEKVKRYRQEKYWGKPLSGFGDPKARLLIIGLAPAAHGGNRTGRMFTGDSSGDWVARVLYENGFATKPTSIHTKDGFALVDAYITAVVKCALPDNKPTKKEINTCTNYLRQEILLLQNVKVIICLGKIAFDALKQILGIKNQKFFHGNSFAHKNMIILASYHPSRQNTQTGRLTWNQWNHIFDTTRTMLDK
ncbi:MAG: uracil-DNA glycosylase [Candidatus Nitrosotenuis sp.]